MMFLKVLGVQVFFQKPAVTFELIYVFFSHLQIFSLDFIICYKQNKAGSSLFYQ